LTAYSRLEQKFPDSPSQCVQTDFSDDKESRFWTIDLSDQTVATRFETEMEPGRRAGGKKGVRILAPMTRFPVVKRVNHRVHAGRISAERIFDPPLRIAGCRFLDIHISTSRAVSS